MRYVFPGGIVLALCLFAAGCGGGGGEEEVKFEGAKHYLTAFNATEVCGQYYGEFRDAIANDNREAAVTALGNFKDQIANCNEEYAAFKPHAWKSVQDCDAACKKLLKTYETVAVPEMNALLEKWTADSPPDPEVVAEATDKINAAVGDEIDAAHEAAKKLQAETTKE